MRRDPRKYLEDMRLATQFVLGTIAGSSLKELQENELIRSAIERKVQIIGESTKLLARFHPVIAKRIHNFRKIISFRNILVHSYDAIDVRVLWQFITRELPDLYNWTRKLMEELGPGP